MPVETYRAVIKSKDVAVYSKAALDLRRWMAAHDPHRPIYHFTGPESWINDPNGPVYYRGRYHLFYQYSPILLDGGRPGLCWGHAVSTDLVHWADWPIAFWPDTPHDCGGVASGNTFADDQGRFCAIYTGIVTSDFPRETYGLLARSKDDGLTWEKKMVMDHSQRPNADSPVHWDGHLWKDGNTWLQLVGGRTAAPDSQGAGWLWTSPDLEHWSLKGNIAPSLKFGDYWELPYLIQFEEADVLMVGCGNPYWTGHFDRQRLLFTPDSEARSVDNGNYYSFNPNMTDDKGPGGKPRRLMHGWVTGPATPTKAVPYWQGAHSIPRVIDIRDGRLWQEPIPEIQCLRGRRHSFKGWDTAREGLRHVEGDALEIVAKFDPGSAKRFGVHLRVSRDRQEYVRVCFDTDSGGTRVDGPTWKRNARDLETIAQEWQPSFLGKGNSVALHIYLDRSIVEVYVNGTAYTARVFPPADARGVDLFCEEGVAVLESLDIWEMKPIW